MNHVVENKVLEELREAKYYCLLIDESTDIALSKNLVVYVNYRLGVSVTISITIVSSKVY